MARSPGFGSDPSNSSLLLDGRPFRTRFRCASTYRLKLATKTNSLTHYTKGTPSSQMTENRNQIGFLISVFCHLTLRLLVGIRFQELFHPAHRGAFHLSLTVLVRYRSLRSTQASSAVPPCSDRMALVPPYSTTSVPVSRTGLSPATARPSRRFRYHKHRPL